MKNRLRDAKVGSIERLEEWRLFSAGQLDTNFGGGRGFVDVDFGGSDRAYEVDHARGRLAATASR